MNDTNLVNIKLKAVQGLLTGDDKNKVGIFPDLTVDNKGIENFPSDEEINTAYEAEKASYDAQEYARNRQYPSIGDQMDMQYHDLLNSTTTWKDAIAKVKADNPKE